MAGNQIDFTCSLYLDFRHASAEIERWKSLTLGTPAALRAWPETAALAGALKRLMGVESALVGRSTFHLLWDLLGLFTPQEWSIAVDEFTYPISRWAADRLACGGTTLIRFRHLNVEDLEYHCRHAKRRRTRPLILTDSFCCVCGQAVRLGSYADIATRYDGLVIVDDTQAIGLFGVDPSPRNPYGRGGGGSFVAQKLANDPVVTVSSLAKAFGAPIAVAAGPSDIIGRLEREGDSRFHCSQPSAADIAATAHALTMNKRSGDSRRANLLTVIKAFREESLRCGLRIVESIHPTQSVMLSASANALELHRILRRHAILCVPGKDHRNEPRLQFLLRSEHTPSAVRGVVRKLANLIARDKPMQKDVHVLNVSSSCSLHVLSKKGRI